jgi:hypothetical protein
MARTSEDIRLPDTVGGFTEQVQAALQAVPGFLKAALSQADSAQVGQRVSLAGSFTGLVEEFESTP